MSNNISLPQTYGRNIIFYGAPGTGKSFTIDQITKGEVGNTRFKDQLQSFQKGTVFRTTFHPDTDYASFVGSYKPVMKDDKISYEFREQTFLKAYKYAWKNPNKQVYLVIEEINRGNCAQIFGDIFQLLDRQDESDFIGYSSYAILPDKDMQEYIRGIQKEVKYQALIKKMELERIKDESDDTKDLTYLALPGNLTILASMNTSDQSLFPIDSAFKRRWEWKYVPIAYEKLEKCPLTIKKDYEWVDVIKGINQFIKDHKNSADKFLGEFFLKPKDKKISYEDFRDKILFYLFNDVFKGDRNFFKTKTIYEDLFIDEEKSKEAVQVWLDKILEELKA